MKCTTCGYILLNLTTPRCPECGTPFDVRDYSFEPGTVAFACPHCGVLHVGHGERYIPATTDQATCDGCGQIMRVGDMRVVPVVDDWDPRYATSVRNVPWENRGSIGCWQAWWRTLRLSLVKPRQLGRQIDAATSLGQGYVFAISCSLFAYIGTGLALGLLLGILLGIGSSYAGTSPPALIGLALIGAALACVVALLHPFFAAALIHLFFLLTGTKTRGFKTTLCSVMYGQGPIALASVPVVGWMLFQPMFIWSLVSTIIIVKQAQDVSGWRAAIACLWWPAVSWLIFFVLPH